MSSGSNGATCTAADLAAGVYCLTRQQYIGLVVVALTGFVSLSAVLFIFSLIARNVIYNRGHAAADAGIPLTEKEPSAAGGESSAAGDESSATGDEAEGSRRLIERPMDLFMLSLFCGSFIQAFGLVLEVKWINEGKVRPGSFCTAQGVFLNLGQSAVAIQTTIITVHTFATIWWQRGVRTLRTAGILVLIMWIFLTLFIAISASVHHTPPFYYPTPYWCSIHSHYSRYRTAGESFWLWIAFAAAVSLYTPLCFYNLGYISPDEDAKWTFKVNSREEAKAVRTGNLPTSKLMICAIAYCAPVLPSALARYFLLVHNDNKPFGSAEAQFSVKAIFGLSGVSEVVVFLLARQNNLLFGQSRGTRTPFNLPAPVRIGAYVATWTALNAFQIVWIYYYILSATDPVPRRKSNDTREGWKSFYVMMYLYGFCVGLVNVGVWLRYIRTIFKFISLMPLRLLRYFLRFLMIVLAVIMCLGPFFAPWIGIQTTQRTGWDRLCKSYSVEVILDGRPYYDSTKGNPSFASFYFGQPGSRTEYYKYGMTQDDNDSTIWHLRLSDITIPPDLDPVYHPAAQDLSYRFANHSVSATCTNRSSSAVTIPCMEGSFSDDETLSLVINDMRTGIVTNLRAVDKGVWAPIPADDAPSVLLRDSLGTNVLRTAVVMKGKCTRLKVCMARGGIDLVAAVGLILKAQDNYAYMCTTPNSN